MSIKDIAPYKGKRKALLQVMADPENIRMDTKAICEKACVSRESYYKWTKDPKFCEAIKDMSINLYVKHLPQSVNSVIKRAKTGDMSANRLMHESIGMISKGNMQTVNIANQLEPDKPVEFDNDSDALAYCDVVDAEIKQIRAGIAARAGNRLPGDAIHPQTEEQGTEEA